MATLDLGEAKALAMKARGEAMKLGGRALEQGTQAWERASPTVGRLMEEPRSFLARLRPEPEPPKAHWAMIAGVAAIGFVAGAAAIGVGRAARNAIAANGHDWMETLKAEHARIDKLFDALVKTGDRDRTKRRMLLAKLSTALTRHTLEKENVLYPALRAANRELAARRLAGEHFEIRSALRELADLPHEDTSFLAKAEALRVMLASHVREEENEVYPAFQSGLSPQENTRLSKAVSREGARLS